MNHRLPGYMLPIALAAGVAFLIACSNPPAAQAISTLAAQNPAGAPIASLQAAPAP